MLVRKQLGRRSRRRRFRRSRPMVMLRKPRTFYGGKIQSYVAEIALPVYICSQTGPVYSYSFSPTGQQLTAQFFNFTSPSYAADISNMFNSFAYYKINGIGLSFTRSVNAALTTVFQLPAIYFDFIHEIETSQLALINNRSIVESDTAMEVQVLNTVATPRSKYYSYGKGDFYNSAGHLNCGKSAWMTSSRTPVHLLCLGYLDSPALSAATESPKIGSVLCKIYMQFCKRIKINNY